MFVVAVFAAVLGIAGGSSVGPALLQADGPPVIGPCPCSDARCLPLCHNVGAPSGLAANGLATSALVAMGAPAVVCPCADARCLPLCLGNP
ncbi:MAG TPA: hypothetical protein VLM79_23310 [Kofleriaceae bacterium]|nr:hypothetical protein [Kofleriaceae bacterium]